MNTSDQAKGTSFSARAQASSPSPTSAASKPPKQHHILPRLKKEDFDRAGKLGINFSVAVEALWANRLRSLLTTLGIIIGVASVIAMVSLVQGFSAIFTDTITSLGTNLIIIAPGSTSSLSTNSYLSSNGGVSSSGLVSALLPTSQTTLSLTPGDAQAITTGPTRIADVTAVSPLLSVNAPVIYRNLHWNTRVVGVDPSLAQIQNLALAEGAWLSTTDNQGARPVAVLGQTVSQQLFAASGQDPIGQQIRVRNQIFRVIGVLPAKGGVANADDAVYVPFSTAQARLKNSLYVDQILVQVDESNHLDDVQAAITQLLEQRHHITKGAADDFNFTTSKQLLETFNQILSLDTALFVSIASISLTVGGIGIMNIMIVSVTERTREIGIRLSIGAQRGDIRNQFLIEAVALSLIGGLIGMFLGLLMGFGLTTRLGAPFVVTPQTWLLPFVISGGVGVLFGFYPAARAARLDPIEALRSL